MPAFATPAIVLGTAAAAGSATTPIRSDSTIVAFDATVPSTQAFGDSAAAGSAAVSARRDHKHAMPATPVTSIAKSGSSALTGAVTVTGSDGIVVTQSSQNIDISVNVLGGGWDAIVSKTLNESVTNSSVLQNDDELLFTAANGAWYYFEAFIVYAVSTSSPGDLNLQFAFGEDTTWRGQYSAQVFATGSTDSGKTATITSGKTNQEAKGSGAVTAAKMMKVWGTHLGAGGTFHFLFAENSPSAATSVTVYAGSFLRYVRVL